LQCSYQNSIDGLHGQDRFECGINPGMLPLESIHLEDEANLNVDMEGESAPRHPANPP
jgi:hypothetical protein